MSDTPKEHDETDYEMIERVFNSDPKLRAALAEKICGPQSDTPRPRTVTITEQDVGRLIDTFGEVLKGIGGKYLSLEEAARTFLASLPDTRVWCAECNDEIVPNDGAICEMCRPASLPDAPPEARGVVVGHQIIPFADAPPSAPDIEAIQELAARHCTGTPDCPVPHGAVDRVALFWPFTSVIEPNAAPERDEPEAG